MELGKKPRGTEAFVSVIGLGCVGLLPAVEFAGSGFDAVGIDRL